MILTKRELKNRSVKFTRAQIAERAIEIGKMCAEGSYKNAIACIGRMVSLSKTIDDGYWQVKMQLGASLEGYFLLSNMREDHPDKKTEVN